MQAARGTYIATTVTTDAFGNARFNVTVPSPLAVGTLVTGTATVDLRGGSYGSTSEFALNQSVVQGVVVDTTDDVADGDTTSIAALASTRGADGRVSLREAIQAANNTANGATPDEIRFLIAGAGPHVIQPASVLPAITQALIINATTEPDYTTALVVRIDGAVAGFSGISIGAPGGGSTIRGLMITGFTVDGINVASGANSVTIDSNWIGTAGSGTTGIGNSDDGIDIAGSNATISNNVITNSGDEGITIVGSGAGRGATIAPRHRWRLRIAGSGGGWQQRRARPTLVVRGENRRDECGAKSF